MRRYGVETNYIKLVETNLNKVATIYIDGSPKYSGNISWFINSTRPGKTHKIPNFIFEGREGNHVSVCATESLVPGEELLIDYNLNRIDAGIAIMGVIILYNI